MPIDSAIVGGQGTSLTIGRPKTHLAPSEKPMRNSARCLAVPSGFLVCALALLITPGRLHGAEIDTYDDHRMAMSLALPGLAVPGVVIRNPGCTAKTYPEYFRDLEKLGI